MNEEDRVALVEETAVIISLVVDAPINYIIRVLNDQDPKDVLAARQWTGAVHLRAGNDLNAQVPARPAFMDRLAEAQKPVPVTSPWEQDKSPEIPVAQTCLPAKRLLNVFNLLSRSPHCWCEAGTNDLIPDHNEACLEVRRVVRVLDRVVEAGQEI